MKHLSNCYPNHLWGMPSAEEEEHTHPFAAPFPSQRRQERVGARVLVGEEKRELSDHLKTPPCRAAGNHSNHQHCFKLNF